MQAYANMQQPQQQPPPQSIQINCQQPAQSQQPHLTVFQQPHHTANNSITIVPSNMQSSQASQAPTQVMQVQSSPVQASHPVRKDTIPPPMVINSNAPKIIELPKTQPNEQLFSLNTLTDQITQLPPGVTTAALGPMDRVLIVPVGITTQQLRQCLLQGQIHFNNIGPATQANETKQIMVPSQPHIAVHQPQPMNTQPIPAPIIVGKPVVDANKTKIGTVIETKAKKTKTRKTKAETNKTTKTELKTMVKSNDDLNKTNVVIKTKTTMPVFNHNQANAMPKVIPMKGVKQTTMCNPNQQINASQTQSIQNAMPIGCDSSVTGPKILQQTIVMPTQQSQPQIMHLHSGDTIKSNLVSQHSVMQQKNVTITVNASSSANVPPLVSMNAAPIMTSPVQPRIQTEYIQLTPQKQQLLKSVQTHIQTLSGKLQNKNLLASIRPMSPNNPMYNKPLPTLTNLNALTDMEIYNMLQRLFVEQQKILATGKVIPTLPAGHSFTATIPTVSPNVSNQSFVSSDTIPSLHNVKPKYAQPEKPTLIAASDQTNQVHQANLSNQINQFEIRIAEKQQHQPQQQQVQHQPPQPVIMANVSPKKEIISPPSTVAVADAPVTPSQPVPVQPAPVSRSSL